MINPISDESKYIVLNKSYFGEKGISVNLDVTDEGMSIKQEYRYRLEDSIEFSDIGELISDGCTPSDFEFCCGKCGLVYILEKNKNIFGAYNYVNNKLKWVYSIEQLLGPVSGFVFVPGTFHFIMNGLNAGMAAVAQVNRQIRWILEATDSKGHERFCPVRIISGSEEDTYLLDSISRCLIKVSKCGSIARVFEIGGEFEIDRLFIAVQNEIPYVLDGKNKLLLTLSDVSGSNKIDRILIDLGVGTNYEGVEPSGLCLDSQGFIYIGECGKKLPGHEEGRTIRVFGSDGGYCGMVSSYRGRTDNLSIDEEDTLFVHDREAGKAYILKKSWALRNESEAMLPEGLFISSSLDSAMHGTKWHKLIFDSTVPDETQVRASYLVSDEKRLFIAGSNRDIDEYIKDDSIESATRVESLNALNWTEIPANPQEALIQGYSGRYIWIRIELVTSGAVSPVMKNIRVYFPRTSYLKYLPAVYSQNAEQSKFLERFLSLFESFFMAADWEIDRITSYFDPEAVKGEYLKWLSSWLAIAVDQGWDDERLRELTLKAAGIYKKRGTREGLEEIIKIFTGDKPFIVEYFQLDCIKDSELKKEYLRVYGNNPYSFNVILKPGPITEKNGASSLRAIVESEKPAHTTGVVKVLKPWIYLGMCSYMGINTYLGKPDLRLDIGSEMPRDTLVPDVKEAGQMQRRSKLGRDTILT